MSESLSGEAVDSRDTDEVDTVVVEAGGSVVTDDLSLATASTETPAGGEDASATGDAGGDSGAGPDDDDDSDENPLETEAEVAADYLEELLDIADLDGDIDTYIEGDRAHVSIVSESQVLVGSDGSVLDALQELTRLAVMTETGNRSRLMLDVAGYRDTRRQQLLAVAGDAVERVRSAGERVSLEPMNPFERKIVHDAVAAAGLVSESEGEEPRRHVVVLPAS
ncbi:MAG: protein jag [Janthinobacterium lividum]